MSPDLTGFKQMIPALRCAFPDMEIVAECLLVEGDEVVDRVTARGTRQGELMGMPPNGQRIEMEEIHITRVIIGTIVERWTQFDMFGLLQQIVGIPESPASA